MEVDSTSTRSFDFRCGCVARSRIVYFSVDLVLLPISPNSDSPCVVSTRCSLGRTYNGSELGYNVVRTLGEGA